MADKENDFRNVNIFWSKEDSDGDEALIPARGNIVAAGNRRPQKKSKSVKGKRTVEVTPTVPSSNKQPVVQNLSSATSVQKTAKDGDKKASLKDLCLEDKQRIANLIKELARLGEEKETTIQAFASERASFETQVHELLSQQDQILRDRENVQTQLHECQDLLVKYQRLVNEQKHQLSESLVETKKSVQFNLSENRAKRNLEHSLSSRNSKGFPARITRGQEHRQDTATPVPQINLEEKFVEQQMLQQRQTSELQFVDRLQSHSQSDNANTERPFTSMIDRLIADEKNRSKSTDDRELKLGPLANPHFESMNVNSTTDFQPLMPDRTTPLSCDSTSNQEESHSVINTNVVGPEFIKPKSVSTPAKKANSALIPEGLSDTEFMDYYKKLTPADRKRQLFVQKQALLEEQERLKTVLAQQEALLEKKHVELRKQQEIQKERLSYFERTGSFPNHFSYQQHDPRQEPFGLPNPPGYMNGSAMSYPNASEYSYPRQPFMPLSHPTHMPGYYGPGPAHYPGPMFDLPVHGYAPHMGPAFAGYGRVPVPGHGMRYGEEDAASQTTKETRSTSTSPPPDNVPENPSSTRRPGYVNHQRDSHVNHQRDSHVNHQRDSQSYHAPHERNRRSQRSSSKPTFEDLRDDRAVHLLDIVDEVESLHNKSMESAPQEVLSPYLVPSGTQRAAFSQNHRNSIPFSEYSAETYSDRQTGRTYEDGDVSTESLEDLEESKVLEDVFFIK